MSDFMNNEEASPFFVDYIMNEIDSLVSEVVKHPENEQRDELFGIISTLSEKYGGVFDYDTILQFVNDIYHERGGLINL